MDEEFYDLDLLEHLQEVQRKWIRQKDLKLVDQKQNYRVHLVTKRLCV